MNYASLYSGLSKRAALSVKREEQSGTSWLWPTLAVLGISGVLGASYFAHRRGNTPDKTVDANSGVNEPVLSAPQEKVPENWTSGNMDEKIDESGTWIPYRTALQDVKSKSGGTVIDIGGGGSGNARVSAAGRSSVFDEPNKPSVFDEPRKSSVFDEPRRSSGFGVPANRRSVFDSSF